MERRDDFVSEADGSRNCENIQKPIAHVAQSDQMVGRAETTKYKRGSDQGAWMRKQ
jgi:hypothetical protein